MGVIWRTARRMLYLGLILWGATVVAVLLFSVHAWNKHGLGRGMEQPADAALVLGGGVDGDGMIAYSSRRRVATAALALAEGRVGRLIFSGGAGANNPRSPADRMADYAESLGVDPGRISIERRARSTFENLRFGFALAEEQGFDRLAIVTDSYHLVRAQALAGYFGRPGIDLIAAPGLVADSYGNRVGAILRESLAWWYNLYKVAGWELLGVLGWDEAERTEWIR